MRTQWLLAAAGIVALTMAVYAQSAAPPASAAQYVGSGACQKCHPAAYDSWKQTLHVQMTRPIAEAEVEGDFRRGTHIEQYGRAYTMAVRDGRYFISVSKGGRPAEEFEVNYTLGARRFQGYLSKLPDGRIYVLPVFWHNDAKRWVDYKEITPIPDDPNHDLRQIWNISCVNCHATNLVKNFNPATNTYNTTWTEMGIACEACHGPGSTHAANPPGHIFAPSKADTRQVFDMCAYCHGNKNNAFYGFKPGERYEDYAVPFLIGQPVPDNDPLGDFWPDGRPSRFNRPQALTLTGCFRSGEATCTSCHRMHGSGNDHMLKVQVDLPGGGHTKQSDTLCTQCHDRVGGAGQAGVAEGAGQTARTAQVGWEGHTHHAADSQGSRCIGCHMSEVNWRMVTRRRDHTFQPPVPEMTKAFGAPNACTTCHEDRTPEWAASLMDTWYGNAEKRRAIVTMGDGLYRAGAGDTAVLPDVARLAADRSHGTLIRASAAELAGQLIARLGLPTDLPAGAPSAKVGTEVVNALIGAAADPEAAVRVTAIRALGLVGDRRVAPILAAHLVDDSRLARVSAAEGLMNLGVDRLEGAQGAALNRAQDEWATSLRFFNDVAADQTTLGWLDAARGRTEEGTKELDIAIALDPSDPRPHVYLGLLAAQQKHYAEALVHFKKAKDISPLYVNLDQLIEQASNLATKRH